MDESQGNATVLYKEECVTGSDCLLMPSYEDFIFY